MNRVKRFRKKAITTVATVTKTEKSTGFRTSYYIIDLQYETINTGILFTGRRATAKKHTPGDLMLLMYLTDDPAVFKIDFGKRLRWWLVFTILFWILINWFWYWLMHLQYPVSPA
jgi:hypothetical protein